jgi:CBS-domain-containing membrane protein
LVVNQKELTYKVIFDLEKTGRKGMAVVDDAGKLLWNFSPSDLRGITVSNCHLLNCPLQEFLEQDRSRDWWTAPVTVDLDSSLYELMQQFVCARVHRMYVVDEDGKPTGEINQRDLLRQILIFVHL